MLLALCCWVALPALSLGAVDDGEWPVYGHDAGGTKYSPLAQINRSNVANLKPAWTFHAGDMYEAKDGNGRPSGFETTPLYVDGTLYLTTAFGRLIALDPETGKERWNFAPKVNTTAGYGDFVNRGAATWVDTRTKQRRLFVATIDAQLIAVDAANGKAIDSFGKGGRIDLRTGLRNPPESVSEYEETSPPAVIGDVIVVGSGVADNGRVNAASGEVRGYDARSGKLKWTFDPMPGQRTGAANAWSIISADPARNLLFVPTGSASPDYYGGERPGNNQYANSVVALRGDTGAVVWSFQTVHHDLWDYDVASQPALITVKRNGQSIDAVAVASKTGHLFILERVTGKPVYGVEERAVPKSDVPGEAASPTQPFPVLPKALVPQTLAASEIWGITDEDRKWCAETLSQLRNEGVFTPPSLRGTVAVPGNIGGLAWGGVTFDPAHNLLIAPSNRLIAYVQLIAREDFKSKKQEDGFEYARQLGTPYAMRRRFIVSPKGSPCNKPPFGALTAIDLATGERKWEAPTGYAPWLAGNPRAAEYGSPSLGGAIATGGGLVFMGGTFDRHLRAYDVENGKVLWTGELPWSARATPMTFRGPDGQQYVVIAAGSHGTGRTVPGETDQGDALIAFKLP
jgi:quinoprotein glucose dehydrogenase